MNVKMSTRGTPRPESQAIRAHVPWSFERHGRLYFKGVADHTIIRTLPRLRLAFSISVSIVETRDQSNHEPKA